MRRAVRWSTVLLAAALGCQGQQAPEERREPPARAPARAPARPQAERIPVPEALPLGLPMEKARPIIGDWQLSHEARDFSDYYQDAVPFDVFGLRPDCAGYSVSRGSLAMMVFGFEDPGAYEKLVQLATARHGTPDFVRTGRVQTSSWGTAPKFGLSIMRSPWGCGRVALGYTDGRLGRSPAFIVVPASARPGRPGPDTEAAAGSILALEEDRGLEMIKLSWTPSVRVSQTRRSTGPCTRRPRGAMALPACAWARARTRSRAGSPPGTTS
ncbi:MAG: hypothetical protein JXR96_13145 [Deltaproteobacteria bacterium]|nr:hypothetical protein [Deltaproteobacteria bacterium]